MKRILYFMHVDWKWIKQRPHFIAEGLASSFVVNAVHEIMYNLKQQKREKNRIENLKINGIPHIPFCRYDFIFNINSFILNKLLLRRKRRRADVVWFGHPMHYNCFKARKGQIVVYDCMDDVLGFSISENMKARFKRLETELCRDADVILASSLHLKNKLAERYGREDIHLVNNAIFLNLDKDIELPQQVYKIFEASQRKKILYIGTISNWFDFAAVEALLTKYDDLELLLFGPTEVNIPKHDRIRHCGILEHKYLLKVMGLSDALIMPFVLNELILSVDPVKAYEYIYSGKPVIMPRYGESEKFEDFVYLYDGVEELDAIFSRLQRGALTPKKSEEDCVKYAKDNSWDSRITRIKQILSLADSKRG